MIASHIFLKLKSMECFGEAFWNYKKPSYSISSRARTCYFICVCNYEKIK